jgi:phage shock protein A
MSKSSGKSVPVDREYLDKTLDKVLKETLNAYTIQIFKYVDTRIKETDDKIEDVKVQLNQVQNTLDDMVGYYKDLTSEQVATAHATVRIDDRLDDHETRINQLESLATTA